MISRNETQNQFHIPPGLAAVAAGRDHISTVETARVLGYAQQTLHKQHCLAGNFLGITPKKIGRRLLWPVQEVASLLNGEGK